MDTTFGEFAPDPRVRADDFMDLTWEMFGELCRALAMRVGQSYAPEVVIGIARAGVIPAGVLASILRADFYSMKISRWGRPRARAGATRSPLRRPPQVKGRRVVLVDEVTTSGETFRLGLAALRDAAPADIRTAAVFVRPRGYTPDHFALETDATVIFPWDRKVFEDGKWVVNPRYSDVLDE